jgi:uncharacterized protein (UPF0335 family)
MTATPKAGHNSGPGIMTYVDRLLILQEAMKACQEDVRELKKEAKDAGKDPKDLVRLAKLKSMGQEEATAGYDEYERHLLTLAWLK